MIQVSDDQKKIICKWLVCGWLANWRMVDAAVAAGLCGYNMSQMANYHQCFDDTDPEYVLSSLSFCAINRISRHISCNAVSIGDLLLLPSNPSPMQRIRL